jgi:type IV pilus assembly protein PilW
VQALRQPSPHRRQRGVTLVELMVGLTLGLIISAALLLLFANASARGQDLSRAGSQIENGRYITEMFREDLRLAGFFGEISQGGATYSQPNPCDVAPSGWSGAPFTLPSPVQGYSATDALACLANRKAGTDAIAIRRVDVVSTDPSTLPGGNSQYYVQYSYCAGALLAPRLVFGTDRSIFTLQNRACTGVNVVRAYISRIYYVADCNVCTPSSDGVPTLKRVDLVGGTLTTTALADGVDMLRFEYGFDVDGDGSPDAYLTQIGLAGPTSLWSNVVAVKAHIVTRSLDKATGANLATAQEFQLGGTPVLDVAADGYTRRAYSSAIRLVNPSSVREVQ